MRALTNKQRVFIETYLATWNATEAARQAGYAKPNVQGPRMLVNVSVAAEVAQRLEALTMSANEVLVRLTEHARGDMADFIKLDPRGGWSLDLPGAVASGKSRLIKKLKESEFGPEIELYSSQDALINLAKMRGMLRERVEVDGMAEMVNAARSLDDKLAALAVASATSEVPRQSD